MFEITLHISPSLFGHAAGFRQLASTGIFEGMGRVAGEIDELMLAALQAEAPVRTGRFRSSIRSSQHASYGGSITLSYAADAPLASWIIDGTAPHIIQPRSPGGVLAFVAASGDLVFTRRVQHPGTQPNNFPQRAWDNVKGEVDDIFARLGRSMFEERG